MPTQEFTYKIIYRKFKHIANLCDDEYTTQEEKLWIINYVSKNMVNWMENTKLVTKDSEPEIPPSKQ